MIPALRNVPRTFTCECFSQMLKTAGDVFGRELHLPLFHRNSLARLDAWISTKHMPDHIHVHRFAVSVGDVIDDVADGPCTGTGISVNYVINEVAPAPLG
jgi:hypothetical protein